MFLVGSVYRLVYKGTWHLWDDDDPLTATDSITTGEHVLILGLVNQVSSVCKFNVLGPRSVGRLTINSANFDDWKEVVACS